MAGEKEMSFVAVHSLRVSICLSRLFYHFVSKAQLVAELTGFLAGIIMGKVTSGKTWADGRDG